VVGGWCNEAANHYSPFTNHHMDIYSFTLALGAAGLGVMGVSGFAHSVGGHHAGHAPTGSHTGHHLATGRGGVRGGARGGVGRAGGARTFLGLLSPRPLFSILVGFGAAGLILPNLFHGVVLFGLAVLGGLLLEFGLMRPLWNFLFRFESAPALTLESCIGDEGRAATTFDAKGNGLVALELDGQVVQVLGSLRREDREAGVRVRAGDPVFIDDVDAQRNRCTVRRA
jgi:translation initiation factor IF-1